MVTVMVMNDTLLTVNDTLLCSMSIVPIQLFQNLTMKILGQGHVVKGHGHIWPWKFKGQGHGQGQPPWSHLRLGVQSICLLFVSLQSDHFWLRYSKFHIWPWKFKVKVMPKVKPDGHNRGLKFNQYGCFFVSWQLDHFWLRYSKFHIWPGKFKVKVMAKVKLDGHIWGLEFHRCVCFSFCGNQSIFGWDIANSIFDLEIEGQGHNENRPKSNQVIYWSGPTIIPKMKEIQKVVHKLLGEQNSAACCGIRTGTKTVNPSKPGWLNSLCPNVAIWWQGSRSLLIQVMAWCLTAPSHYLNQCWLIIGKVQWNSSECNFTWDTSAISHWN